MVEEPHHAFTRCGGQGVMPATLDGKDFPAPCWCVVYPRDQLALLAGYLGVSSSGRGPGPG